MLELLFELIFEFFGELLLQLVAELFGDGLKFGWRRLRGQQGQSSRTREAAWALFAGAVAGALATWLFPVLAIRLPWLQMLNLVLAPLAAGLAVERVRAWRESRAAFSWPIFCYAALFGAAFALTRWLMGH